MTDNKRIISNTIKNNPSLIKNESYKQYDEEKVVEIRTKLNNYYIDKKPAISLNNTRYNNNILTVNKQIQNTKDIKNNPNLANNMYKHPLRESENNFLGINYRFGDFPRNGPVKLHQLNDNNNTNKFNTIQSISITDNSRIPVIIKNSPNTLDGYEKDPNVSKRKEDLQILKNFAENFSVNESYENYHNKNYTVADDSNSYSIYNKKQIHRKDSKESIQNVKSEYKLDKFSREYLLNKLNAFDRDSKFCDNN